MKNQDACVCACVFGAAVARNPTQSAASFCWVSRWRLSHDVRLPGSRVTGWGAGLRGVGQLHGLLLLRVPTVVLGRTLVGVPGGRLVLVPLVVWRVLGPVRLLRGPAWTVVRRITLLSALGGSGRRRERGEEEERRRRESVAESSRERPRAKRRRQVVTSRTRIQAAAAGSDLRSTFGSRPGPGHPGRGSRSSRRPLPFPWSCPVSRFFTFSSSCARAEVVVLVGKLSP